MGAVAVALRLSTDVPMRPRPIMPTVLPASSVPQSHFGFQVPQPPLQKKKKHEQGYVSLWPGAGKSIVRHWPTFLLQSLPEECVGK